MRYCGPTSKLRHLLRFSLVPQLYAEILLADRITLKHIERIVARPLPEGWETNAATPAAQEGLGFQLLTNAYHRSACIDALESIERSALEAAV